MEYEKYIVPIYTSNNSMPIEDDFNGNGIIIDNYLITAGHVVKNVEIPVQPVKNVWFRFDGELYKLDEKPIFFERDEQYQEIDNKTLFKLDLAIYSINKKIKSPIEFVNEQQEYSNCSYCGYSMNEDTKQLKFDYANPIKVYTKVPKRRNDVVFYIKNCFSFVTKYPLKNGNSGGGLFQDNRFVGLFVSSSLDEYYILIDYQCISAQYIKEKINSLK